jgi:hypothetical protein
MSLTEKDRRAVVRLINSLVSVRTNGSSRQPHARS